MYFTPKEIYERLSLNYVLQIFYRLGIRQATDQYSHRQISFTFNSFIANHTLQGGHIGNYPFGIWFQKLGMELLNIRIGRPVLTQLLNKLVKACVTCLHYFGISYEQQLTTWAIASLQIAQ